MEDGKGGTDPASLAQAWFEVRTPEPGIFTIIEPLHEEEVKSYLIVGDERALLLDTGMGVGDIRVLTESLTDKPVFVVDSHAHWDHIGGNHLFDEIWIHAAEADRLDAGVPNERLRRAFAPDQMKGPFPAGFDVDSVSFPPKPATGILQGGESFNLGGRSLDVIHCPGHSPGGIALLEPDRGVLFSTDVAYPCALYAFGPDADMAAYHASLTRLAALAPVLRAVYTSHCASPMDAALLPRMRDAMGEILSGREPDGAKDGIGQHLFEGFSVLTPTEGDAA